MKLIGLTGGIGMGKSTAADFLRQRGVPVADTDQIARDVVEPGQPALAEVAAVFGPEVIDGDGRLLRPKLAEKVFASEAQRKQLEAILHPRIRERWLAQAEAWRGAGERLGVVVIPLLYETAAEKNFDRVICVACSAASQQQRLLARGWPAGQISQRLAAQWPVEKKLALANYVVWTEAGVEVQAAQLDGLLRRL